MEREKASDKPQNPMPKQLKVHMIPFILEGRYGIMTVENPASNIEVGTLQGILDELLKKNRL